MHRQSWLASDSLWEMVQKFCGQVSCLDASLGLLFHLVERPMTGSYPRGHFPLLMGDCLVLRQNQLLLYSFYLYSLIILPDPDRTSQQKRHKSPPITSLTACFLHHPAWSAGRYRRAFFISWREKRCLCCLGDLFIGIDRCQYISIPKNSVQRICSVGRWLDRYCQHHTYPLSLIYWLMQFTFRKLTYYQTKECTAWSNHLRSS